MNLFARKMSIDIDSCNDHELSVIREACEEAKKNLSKETRTEVIISGQGYAFHLMSNDYMRKLDFHSFNQFHI